MAEIKEGGATKGVEAVNDQFRRNLSHILIDLDNKGPEITIGDVTLNFVEKAPLDSIIELISNPNQIDGMRAYVALCLKPESVDAFASMGHRIGVEGLGEIIAVLGEAYTSFPSES